jgi:hypothetical protein
MLPAETLYVQMFQLEHISGFYRNTVEMSENSENHLKAILSERQAAERNRVRQRVEKVAEKPQGEGKATKKSERAGNRG